MWGWRGRRWLRLQLQQNSRHQPPSVSLPEQPLLRPLQPYGTGQVGDQSQDLHADQFSPSHAVLCQLFASCNNTWCLGNSNNRLFMVPCVARVTNAYRHKDMLILSHTHTHMHACTHMHTNTCTHPPTHAHTCTHTTNRCVTGDGSAEWEEKQQ